MPNLWHLVSFKYVKLASSELFCGGEAVVLGQIAPGFIGTDADAVDTVVVLCASYAYSAHESPAVPGRTTASVVDVRLPLCRAPSTRKIRPCAI